MLSKNLIEKYTFALQVIGCKVDTYGHFAVYEIPDKEGYGWNQVLSKDNIDYFLSMVEGHYTSRSSINKDFGDDLKEQNAVKSFIKAKIKKDPQGCLIMGIDWLKEQGVS